MRPETRARISEAVQRRWNDPEQREKMRAVGKRPPPSPENIEKMAAARLAKWNDPAYKARRSAAMKKRWAKNHDTMAATLAETRRRPEVREKMRQGRLNRTDFKRTDIEILLGDAMRSIGLEFAEQRPFLARFIPDFTFEKSMLLVQADGEYWHRFKRNREYDRRLRKALEGTGWIVLRFNAKDIHNDPFGIARTVAQFVCESEGGTSPDPKYQTL